MLNVPSRTWLIGGWIVAPALVVTASISMGASLSTTVLLAVLGVAPGIIIALLEGGTVSPSVAQILHPGEAKDGRP